MGYSLLAVGRRCKIQRGIVASADSTVTAS